MHCYYCSKESRVIRIISKHKEIFHSGQAFLYWIWQEFFYNIEDNFLWVTKCGRTFGILEGWKDTLLRHFDGVSWSTNFHLQPMQFRVWIPIQLEDTWKGKWKLFQTCIWFHTGWRLFNVNCAFIFRVMSGLKTHDNCQHFKSRLFRCSIYLVNFALFVDKLR